MQEENKDTNGLIDNSEYQKLDEKASIKTGVKSEISTLKSSNTKLEKPNQESKISKLKGSDNKLDDQKCLQTENIKRVQIPEISTSNSSNNKLDESLEKKCLKSDNNKPSQEFGLCSVKSSSYHLNELLLTLINLYSINKDLKVFYGIPAKNDFFDEREVKAFGIVIIYSINKIKDEFYQYKFCKITNFIHFPYDHFIKSINNKYIYIDLKLYNKSELLFIDKTGSSDQLSENNYESINGEDVTYLYINKQFVYSLNFNYSQTNNSNSIKVNIKLIYSKNINYSSTFENAFSKIIKKYNIINQMVKDILNKGYYFIFFQEKKELYKVTSLIKKREIKIKIFIPLEQNLIDEFIDRKNAERIKQIEQSDYIKLCNESIDRDPDELFD